MPAHLDAIQQQNRHIQAKTALQLGVGIHIEKLQFGERARGAQGRQLRLQLFTQAAIGAGQQRQARTQRGGPMPRSAGAMGGIGMPLAGALAPGCESMELAMARTVSGGTSPMAVTR